MGNSALDSIFFCLQAKIWMIIVVCFHLMILKKNDDIIFDYFKNEQFHLNWIFRSEWSKKI